MHINYDETTQQYHDKLMWDMKGTPQADHEGNTSGRLRAMLAVEEQRTPLRCPKARPLDILGFPFGPFVKVPKRDHLLLPSPEGQVLAAPK